MAEPIPTAIPALTPDGLLRALTWRYAVKKFDASRKIPAETWAALEQALVLTPSSFWLQPWAFFLVRDPARREALVAASWGQRQVVDASHMVVFAIRKGLSSADVDKYVARIAEVRGVAPETLAGYRKVMLGFVGRPPEAFDVDEWSARQVYIALGQFMAAAAVLGVDTCPMEGLDPKAYDRILGLEGTGYETVCACPAGYRSAGDVFATQAKVRFPLADIVKTIG